MVGGSASDAATSSEFQQSMCAILDFVAGVNGTTFVEAVDFQLPSPDAAPSPLPSPSRRLLQLGGLPLDVVSKLVSSGCAKSQSFPGSAIEATFYLPSPTLEGAWDILEQVQLALKTNITSTQALVEEATGFCILPDASSWKDPYVPYSPPPPSTPPPPPVGNSPSPYDYVPEGAPNEYNYDPYPYPSYNPPADYPSYNYGPLTPFNPMTPYDYGNYGTYPSSYPAGGTPSGGYPYGDYPGSYPGSYPGGYGPAGAPPYGNDTSTSSRMAAEDCDAAPECKLMVVNAGCCGTQGIVATSSTLDVVLVCNRPVAPLPETCLVVSNPATQLPLNATAFMASEPTPQATRYGIELSEDAMLESTSAEGLALVQLDVNSEDKKCTLQLLEPCAFDGLDFDQVPGLEPNYITVLASVTEDTPAPEPSPAAPEGAPSNEAAPAPSKAPSLVLGEGSSGTSSIRKSKPGVPVGVDSLAAPSLDTSLLSLAVDALTPVAWLPSNTSEMCAMTTYEELPLGWQTGGLLDAEGYVLECDGPNPTFWDVWQLLAATPAPLLEPFDESAVSNGWWQQQIDTINSQDKGSTAGGDVGTDTSASDYSFSYVPY